QDDTPIMDQKVFDHIAKLVYENGSNVWFERDVKDLLPEGYTHPGSPDGIFRKETDTMDVWFDSGSSHTGCLKERGYDLPCDLYFEGSDQYRGWFNSSLIVSTAVYGHAPYKAVLSHGFVMDKNGVKMSKSQFNAVAPTNIMKQYGADILRLWATTVDYQADCVMSDDLLKQCAETYRKVRNTFRFMLANINSSDFTKEDLVAVNELTLLDQAILLRLNEVSASAKKAYQDYDFMSVTSTLATFMSNELSSYYLDFTKDILYIECKDDLRRRQVQSVIYYCTDTLMKLWAPILVHTCEEINDIFDNSESVHLKEFNEEYVIENAQDIQNKMNRLMALRADVFKALEEARAEKIIGKSLEASVYMHVNHDDQIVIEEVLGQRLAQWLIVSRCELSNETFKEYENCQVKVEKCEGKVCPRCWNIHPLNDAHECCDRCVEVLKKEYKEVPIE
ncbi:MAG: class I tRNA ligase family protein, partial [Traorella sp.]